MRNCGFRNSPNQNSYQISNLSVQICSERDVKKICSDHRKQITECFCDPPLVDKVMLVIDSMLGGRRVATPLAEQNGNFNTSF